MNRLIVALILMTLLAGCGARTTGQTPNIPTPPSAPSPALASPLPAEISTATPLAPAALPPIDATMAAALAAQLSAAEQHWQASDIASYRITVLEIHSIWSAQRMTITVTDGHVVDIQSMCIPAPAQGRTCTIKPVEPSNYLVPMLLKQARKLLTEQRPEHVQLVFDSTLGYPTTIGYNNLQILDEDYGLMVETFERLPGRPASELGEFVTLKVGETVQAEELTITLVGIVEDSRCPTNVDCAWSGQVVSELKVVAPNHDPETVRLTLMGNGLKLEEPSLVADVWQLQLTSVIPYPITPDDISDEDYQVIVQVSKAS